jgi:hypothetical protein
VAAAAGEEGCRSLGAEGVGREEGSLGAEVGFSLISIRKKYLS